MWYMLTPSYASGAGFACYGYICAEYPAALLTESCPQGLSDILSELGILSAMLDELEPVVVLVYGAMPRQVFEGLDSRTRFVNYPDWITYKKAGGL